MIFHRALKKAPLTLLERDTPRKCRDNEGVIHYRPGKAVLHELKKVLASDFNLLQIYNFEKQKIEIRKKLVLYWTCK